MGYSSQILNALAKEKISEGQRIEIKKGVEHYEGILMPKSAGDANTLVIKLDNGYNIGIAFDGAKIKKMKEKTELKKRISIEKQKIDTGKPTIAILTTGGTIASKVDYKTGAVTPIFTVEDLLSSVPELLNIANFRMFPVFQMFSEDMESEHWSVLAKKIYEEISSGVDGLIITHGTDTMYYTAAALAFALQGLPVPVILTASQRSSDRPSSDASINLICAAHFIAKSHFSGVAVCMHETADDDNCIIMEACKTRKMHTSRRDTYRPMNSMPLARVGYAGSVEFLTEKYSKKGRQNKTNLQNKFSKNVGLVKVYPGFKAEQLEWFEKNCDGLVIEGYAFGQMPINALDEFTKHHPGLLKKIREIAMRMPVVMVSQIPYGIVNMDVYSTSREILNAGVIEAHMQAPVAYVKLCWLLGQSKDIGKIRELMKKDFCGDVVSRIEAGKFLL